MSATPVTIGASDILEAASPPGYYKYLYDMSGGDATLVLGLICGPIKELIQHLGVDVLVVLAGTDADVKFGLLTHAATDDDYFLAETALSTAAAGTQYGTNKSGGWSFASTANTAAKRTITGPAYLTCTVDVNAATTGKIIIWVKSEYISTLYGTPVNRSEA